VALSSNPGNLHKEKTSQKKNDNKTPKSTNPHPFGALIDDSIDDENLDLYFKKSRNTSGRNTTRKYASQLIQLVRLRKIRKGSQSMPKLFECTHQ
jgi:hypothetical protein